MPLFDTVEEALQAVAEDLAEGFGGMFREVEPVRPVGVFAEQAVGALPSPDADERAALVSVLAWEWPVHHVGSIQGTPATLRDVTLRGMTVIDERSGERLFSRYIDWLGLYAELGALSIARPLVEDRKAIEDNVSHDVDQITDR
jgi:hypothetical protein